MKKVRELITSYIELIDEKEILICENQLTYYIYFPILVFGSVLNFIYFTYFFPQNNTDVMVNSLFLIVMALCFLLVGKYGRNEISKVFIFIVLFALILAFCVIRYYFYIGPSVWNIACIFIMISIIRNYRSMLVLVTVTLFLALITWYRAEPYELGVTYYVSQVVTFALLFLISIIIHNINKQRKDKMMEQLQTIKSSKVFIEEVNATLEEVNTALEEEIQEHMMTQRYLSASEEKFRLIFEGSADPVLII